VFAPECTLADAIAALVATIEDLIVGTARGECTTAACTLASSTTSSTRTIRRPARPLERRTLRPCRHASEDHQHRSSRGPRPPSPPPTPAKPGARTLKAGSAKPLVWSQNGVKDFAQQKAKLQATEQEGLGAGDGTRTASLGKRPAFENTTTWRSRSALTATEQHRGTKHLRAPHHKRSHSIEAKSLPWSALPLPLYHCVEHQAERFASPPGTRLRRPDDLGNTSEHRTDDTAHNTKML